MWIGAKKKKQICYWHRYMHIEMVETSTQSRKVARTLLSTTINKLNMRIKIANTIPLASLVPWYNIFSAK